MIYDKRVILVVQGGETIEDVIKERFNVEIDDADNDLALIEKYFYSFSLLKKARGSDIDIDIYQMKVDLS